MSHRFSRLGIANDSVLSLEGLVDQDDAPVTTATVELTSLTDADGNTVAGISLPAPMPHVGDGTYKGALPAALAVTAGGVYKATVRAVAGGVTATFVETIVALDRAA